MAAQPPNATKSTTPNQNMRAANRQCCRVDVCGACSTCSTRAWASQWKTLANSRAVNNAKTRVVSSSRNTVNARQVSVTAYLAFSCNNSTSASLKLPKNTALADRPASSVSTITWLPKANTQSLLVTR